MSDYERAARNLIEKGSPLDCFIREGADADRLIAEQQQRIKELEVERDRLVEFIRSIDSRLDELLALNALREPAP